MCLILDKNYRKAFLRKLQVSKKKYYRSGSEVSRTNTRLIKILFCSEMHDICAYTCGQYFHIFPLIILIFSTNFFFTLLSLYLRSSTYSLSHFSLQFYSCNYASLPRYNNPSLNELMNRKSILIN
jgi:hypothetical protein